MKRKLILNLISSLFTLLPGTTFSTFESEDCLDLFNGNESECDTSYFSGCVKFNPCYTFQMLDHTENLQKVEILLRARQSYELEDFTLYLGFSIIPIIDYQISNKDSKFAYLMRHPTSNNQIGKHVSEAVLHSAQMNLTANINSWITAYGELLYNPEQSFGSGTITALGRNQVQLRKGYALIGDLNQYPFYLAVGKMDTPFGQTGTVSPFTNSTMWHAFGGLAYGALFGVDWCGFNALLMAVQGGSQFRAHHSSVKGTNVPSRLNNFVINASYTFDTKDLCFLIGSSYEHGSAYCQNFPVEHFNACDSNVAAWTVYGKLTWSDLTLKGGFAQTVDVWPGTHNPNPPLNIFKAHKVSSIDLGGKWDFYSSEYWDHSISLEFSNFVAGPDQSPWERQSQTVLGLSSLYCYFTKFFAEVIRTDGYAPLNFISGGNLAVGETHSVSNAHSTVFIVGTQIAF